MTMKKKLTVTTLAASIMFASIAGLPLSENGLANKLGITTGVASATTLTIQEKLDGLRAELARDSQGLVDVNATRAFIASDAGNISADTMKVLLGNVWTKITAKSDVGLGPVYALISNLDPFSDTSAAAIDALIKNSTTRDALNELFTDVALPGIDAVDGLSKQSVIDFQELVLNVLQQQTSKDALIGSVASAFLADSTAPIINAMDTILTTKVFNQSLLISQFLNKYGISLSDLNGVQERIADHLTTIDSAKGNQAKNAITASESAVLRYLLDDKIKYVAVNSSSTSIEPGLTVLGISANNRLTWSLHSGTGVKFESGKLVLNGANSGSGKIQARDSKFGLLLYISDSLTLTSSVSSDPTPIVEIKDTSADLTKNLNDLKDQLKDAPEDKKNEIFKQAQDAVKNAIQKLAAIDLKSQVKVEGNVAKPTLNVTELANKMKDIATKSKELNDQLKQLNPNAKSEKIELKLDFGTTTAKTTEIPFAKELLASARENGIDTVSVSMNGLTLGVSPTEFSADTTLKVSDQDKSEATDVTKLKIASDVYNFEFTSGGNEIHTFSKPVTIKLPIADVSDVDTDLLTLAKIINGKLEYYGGRYQNGTFNAQRNGFSTYTVVENKVDFGDTSSVKAWAGRQIQVAAAKGILEGRAEQAFDPNGLVTRAEFAKMIVKTFSLENASATENFTDVNDSDWYKVYVASAVENGIVNGKEAGKFDPNGQITRAEMAVMSSRALALQGISLSPAKVEDALKGFTDVNAINASLKDGVALAASEGIVIGEEGNVFNPNANSTRAQAAVVIYRLLNK